MFEISILPHKLDLKCPECGEIVNQCEYCKDYLVINNNAYCDGFDHMCKQCYEELRSEYKKLEK